MSQVRLAEGLGVAFQQVQKYEKGISTIGAGRLHHAASILNVPITFFFPEPEPSHPANCNGHESQSQTAEDLLDFLGTSEGVELGAAFSEIGDPDLRRRVVDLVRSIARNSGEDAER